MQNKELLFKKMLVEDLDSKFMKEFSRRLPIIYQESMSRSFNDDMVKEEFKAYCFGHTRYVLVQGLLQSVAQECGHLTYLSRCEKNNFPIPLLKIGRFYFTIHHSFENKEHTATRVSLARKQYSQINEDYVQQNLFIPNYNEEKLLAANRIYANIIYGCRTSRDFSNSGFLRIAIPYIKKINNKEVLRYAENHNFNDILQLILEKEKSEQAQKPIINIATPKLKIKKS